MVDMDELPNEPPVCFGNFDQAFDECRGCKDCAYCRAVTIASAGIVREWLNGE